jgi:hypothetical protein
MTGSHCVNRSLITLFLVTVLCATLGAQDRSNHPRLPEPISAVLWTPPNDIAKRDLFHGPGGVQGAPNLRRVTLIKEEKGGYSTKFRVRDGSGREWVAKVGKEAQAETAAVRLVWAVGYETEINYLVPTVNIRGKGVFHNVRFEARPQNIKRDGEWSWNRNPFIGTPELQGLKIMMALLNNWDLKDSNNEILTIRGGADQGQRLYIISDLGATFGKASGVPFFWRIMRSRNNPDDYQEAKFVDGIKGDRVDLNYHGKNRELFDDIKLEDASWIADWLARLTDRQLSDAFRAANYDRQDIRVLSATVRRRINELTQLSQKTARSGS